MTNEDNTKQEGWKKLREIGADLAGSLGGVGIGLAVAGPVGAIGGAVAAPAITHLIHTVAEFSQRQLGRQEEKRISITVGLVAEKLKLNLANGQQMRNDDFFHDQPNDRSAAEEIAEGVLLVAQREYEERKLRYYANLLANFAFHPEIDRALANRLIRTAERLSYRQLCFIVIVATWGDLRAHSEVFEQPDLPHLALLEELHDLYQQGVFQRIGHTPDPETAIRWLMLTLSDFGTKLYDLMELSSISADDIDNVGKLLHG